ncbi:MAG: hypothetical protein BGO49_29735 [Planctomycetales bacterium 71-10]|nr:MAG: hypothetical protein BGO49_29735 [Planctomycetales bacterium 71-10]
MIRRIAALAAALMLLGARPSPAQDDAALGLGDLAAEHDALSGKGDGASPVSATFRDLWDRPDEFRGRRVRVVGRVVRTFRQDAVGSFPALVEAWIEQPPGDLLCLVFPAPTRGADSWKGATVQFVGVSLRRVRYKAEGERLAPLIVGPEAPTIEEPAPTAMPESPPEGWSGPMAVVGLLAGMVAISALLAWRTLAAPSHRGARARGRRIDAGPAPEFLGPEDEHGESR